MKKRILTLAFIGVLGSTAALATSLYVSPDVPTTLSATPRFPWDIVRYDSGVYSAGLSLPDMTVIDGLHRMDGGDWLFSVEAPRTLGAVTADPRDVVRYDGVTFSLFFCGATVGVPAGSNVDAVILLSPGDAGPLAVSFDIPTGGFEPSDLVRFTRTGPLCGDWMVAGALFDGSAAAPAVPISTDVTAGDVRPPLTLLSFDVPTTLGAPFIPGDIASWNGAAFMLFEPLATWPISTIVNAMTLLPDPGLVPPTMLANKLTPSGSMINLAWSTSCSVGAETYGIYEGAIGTWYGHTLVDCMDDFSDLNEDIGTTSGNQYYLVVPRNDNDEGSYGTDSSSVQRPVGTAQCVTTQVAGPCP